MPDYVIAKLAHGLNERQKSVRGSKVLVLGVAYKKNVDDVRESPSVMLMEKLRDLGAEVAYSDPFIPTFPKMRRHAFNLKSVELNTKNLAAFDCVLLATDHDDFDYALIEKHAKLIIDARGRFLEPKPHIIKA